MTLPIARLFGIEIRVSAAWAILLALITVIGAEQASDAAPLLAAPVQWAMGLAVAILILVSVVAHELAHALVGRRRGVAVSSLNLGFIGGLAPLAIQAQRPDGELAIAAAGPVLSLAVGAALAAVGLVLDTAVPATSPIGAGIAVVGVLNLILGGLSIVPAMPLDGGRIVRALAWWRTGDRDAAGRITARVGRMIGWTIIGVGIALLFAGDYLTEGLIAVALGWLLSTGARTVERRLALEQLLRGVSVGDAMERDVPFVGPHLTVDTFAGRFDGPDAVAALPVVEDDRVVGIVGRRRLVRLGRGKYGDTRVDEVMAVPPEAPVLAPSDALWDAVEALNEGALDGLAVAVDGRLAGLVTRDGVTASIRALAARQAGAAAGVIGGRR